MQRKLVLDCEYIVRAGLWLDVRLMLCTFLRIFKIPEGWLHCVLGVGRDVEIPGLPDTPSVDGGPSAGSAEATPAAILLQIGNQPDPAASAADHDHGYMVPDGESNGHGTHFGNGTAQRMSRRKYRGKRPDNGKAR